MSGNRAFGPYLGYSRGWQKVENNFDVQSESHSGHATTATTAAITLGQYNVASDVKLYVCTGQQRP